MSAVPPANNKFFCALKWLLVVCGLGTSLGVLFFLYRGKQVSFSRSKTHFSIPTQGVKKVVLKNGMTVLMFQNHSVPKVLVQIAYDIGSYVEKSGERGLAHLLEHMIFKGTATLGESDIDAIARKFGATYNAFTSMDVTSYYFEVNKNNWKPFFGILSDCMQHAKFDEQHLASELQTVIQELKMYKDRYWNMMFQKACELIFPANHPYHYPIIGYKDDLLHISVGALKSFYKQHYTPQHALLLVIGDIDTEEIVKEAEACFGKITSTPTVEDSPFPREELELVVHHARMYEDVQAEQLGLFWRISGSKHKHELAASVSAFLLGHGEGSRLYRSLVDQAKIASSVSVAAEKFMESGIFLILVEPLPGKTQECIALIKQEIKLAEKNGFTPQELEHMVKVQGKNFFQYLQTFEDFSYKWLTSYFATDDEYALFNRVNKFVELESQEVQEFLREYLDPLFMHTLDVVPLPAEKHSLRDRIQRESDALDAAILARFKRTEPIATPQAALQMGQPEPLEFSFPKPDKRFVLDNGLTVLLKRNSQLPIISASLKFKEFSYNSLSRDGIGIGIMMDMLMEGCAGYTRDELINFFELNGVGYSFGSQGASLSMLNSNVQEVLHRFIHVLTKPLFQATALEKIKHQMSDGIKRDKDDLIKVAVQDFKNIIYANHPFQWSFDDALVLTEKVSIKDIEQLHQHHVTPGNMVLSLVGDFDLAQMETMIRTDFGSWKAGTPPVISYPARHFVPKKHIDRFMRRDQVVLILGKPSDVDIYHPDYVPLKLLNYVGFDGLGSRIFQLREQSGLFYTSFGGYGVKATKEKGFDYVGAILSPDKLDYAEKGMRELIAQMAKDGVTEAEVASARQLYLKELLDKVETNGSVSQTLAMLECLQLGFDYYDKVLKRVQTMTADELNTVCKRYFLTDSMARIRVGRVDAST